MKGGYQLIDLENKSFLAGSSTGQTIKGIYKLVESAFKYRKNVILTNVNFLSDDTEQIMKNDISGTLAKEDDHYMISFVFYGNSTNVVIYENDEVYLNS